MVCNVILVLGHDIDFNTFHEMQILPSIDLAEYYISILDRLFKWRDRHELS